MREAVGRLRPGTRAASTAAQVKEGRTDRRLATSAVDQLRRGERHASTAGGATLGRAACDREQPPLWRQRQCAAAVPHRGTGQRPPPPVCPFLVRSEVGWRSTRGSGCELPDAAPDAALPRGSSGARAARRRRRRVHDPKQRRQMLALAGDASPPAPRRRVDLEAARVAATERDACIRRMAIHPRSTVLLPKRAPAASSWAKTLLSTQCPVPS